MDYKKLLRYVPAIVISLTVVYAGFILYFILRYGVDVPYNDQWEYVSFFDHLAKGTLTFHELFKFQGDYRQFFPNLIFVGLGSLTKWNVKYEMVLIFIMVCWIAYNVYRLAAYTIVGDKWQKWLAFFIAVIFIFSPFQYENWLFGVQIEYFIPILCITTGMVVAMTNMNKVLKLIFGMLLSIISIYSSANGLLCWFIIYPVFCISGPDKEYFKKWKIMGIWAYVAIMTILIYFAGYKTPLRHPSITLFFENPGDAIMYFFGVLGNPFRIVHKLNAVIIVGAGLFTIFILLVLYIVKHFRDKQLVRVSIIWIMVGLYSLGTSAFLTAGRLGFGVAQSLMPRYTSYSLYLIVAILFLATIVMLHWAQKARVNKVHKVFLIVLIALLFYNRANKYRDSVTDLKTFHAHIVHGKAGLLLINYISPNECSNKVFPFEFKKLKKRARTLDSLGLLRPGLIKSNVMQDIQLPVKTENEHGSFDKLVRLNDTLFVASGYSLIPNTWNPADAVVFTYDNDMKQSLVFNMYNADSIHWKKTFSIAKIKANPIILNAWALDANSGKAYKLRGSYVIP